ncbi:hypothetical protein NE235_36235 [Actinoallomurus spadix]|uniref:PASTA domain-containing protein n=1 Tax=Actinoallomurus spadix TaxID=79912 RepID=A0ABN0X4K7_9ACTN|nr:PASTA domain-containing protein [Actinoallomurus spadix]MCO5991578.1 hypothetical protein [Actinoallomurus spadix]
MTSSSSRRRPDPRAVPLAFLARVILALAVLAGLGSAVLTFGGAGHADAAPVGHCPPGGVTAPSGGGAAITVPNCPNTSPGRNPDPGIDPVPPPACVGGQVISGICIPGAQFSAAQKCLLTGNGPGAEEDLRQLFLKHLLDQAIAKSGGTVLDQRLNGHHDLKPQDIADLIKNGSLSPGEMAAAYAQAVQDLAEHAHGQSSTGNTCADTGGSQSSGDRPEETGPTKGSDSANSAKTEGGQSSGDGTEETGPNKGFDSAHDGSATTGEPAAAQVPDLTGKSLEEAERELAEHGFTFKREAPSGYRLYVAADGSEIWIRPDGEVIRTGPKIDPGPNKRNYRYRYDQNGNLLPRNDANGNPLNNHNTGERVIRP